MQLSRTNKNLSIAINGLFDPLENKENTEQYQTLLRNKSSFVSLISKDDFVSTNLVASTKKIYKNVLEYIYCKFKAWVASFYETQDDYFMTARELAVFERDIFGNAYDVVGTEEEYDIDNIVL